MGELVSINHLERLAIPELCNKKFFIPEYQRGYRWGRLQVKQLLEDVCSFFYKDSKSGDFYCLQPVVVKKMDEEAKDKHHLNKEETWYEVIDGQQRLTTIKIILLLVSLWNPHKKKDLTLYYGTRPKLGEFFKKLKLVEKDVVSITTDKQNLDIDSWHILEAANTIIRWFQPETDEPVNPTLEGFDGDFYQYFINGKDNINNKSVQVIWYELLDGSDPYDMFKRLNDQRVSLNNAELIRGMFLSDSAIYKCDDERLKQFKQDTKEIAKKLEKEKKQSHIIEMWDIIESNLRNEKFWAFIKNDNDATKYSCRIEYLFDLISKKTIDDKDSLYTYLEFDKMLKERKMEDLWQLWMEVEKCYFQLKSWFEDNYYYHKIGYLIAISGSSVLMDLLSQSSTQLKNKFKEYIQNKIKETILYKNGSKRILDYSYEEDYNLLKNVLLLYNVESSFNREKEYFPFDEYKKEKNWTLEHIHAQNSEMIDQSDKGKWKKWFEINIVTLNNLRDVLPEDTGVKGVASFLESENKKLNENENQFSFKDLTFAFDRVLNFFNHLATKEDNSKVSHGVANMIHGIANMALLSGSVNTSISNSVFEVKRQKIMKMDAEGEYIPLCTRNVFLKYYNKNDEGFTVQQNFCWDVTDRENYLNDIKDTLKDYIEIQKNNSDIKQMETEEREVSNE